MKAFLPETETIITAIKTDGFITDNVRHQLRRAAWRAQHADM